jgi:hypothetical protein
MGYSKVETTLDPADLLELKRLVLGPAYPGKPAVAAWLRRKGFTFSWGAIDRFVTKVRATVDTGADVPMPYRPAPESLTTAQLREELGALDIHLAEVLARIDALRGEAARRSSVPTAILPSTSPAKPAPTGPP